MVHFLRWTFSSGPDDDVALKKVSIVVTGPKPLAFLEGGDVGQPCLKHIKTMFLFNSHTTIHLSSTGQMEKPSWQKNDANRIRNILLISDKEMVGLTGAPARAF